MPPPPPPPPAGPPPPAPPPGPVAPPKLNKNDANARGALLNSIQNKGAIKLKKVPKDEINDRSGVQAAGGGGGSAGGLSNFKYHTGVLLGFVSLWIIDDQGLTRIEP